MGLVKVGAALAIVLLVLVIHLANPAFFPHLCGLLARGDIQETAGYIQSFGGWAVVFSFLLTLFDNSIGYPTSKIFSSALLPRRCSRPSSGTIPSRGRKLRRG